MARDILLSIPTRNRPEGAAAVMELMLEAAFDPKCFTFQLVIDSDQLELYRPVIKKYSDRTIVAIAEHGGKGLRNVFIKQLEQFIETGSYFLWSLTDDVYGAVHHWDQYLINAKHFYKDDLFLIGSTCVELGRSLDVFKSCYCLDWDSAPLQTAAGQSVQFTGLDPTNQFDTDFLVLYTFCELFPAYTRRFAQYLQRAFLESDHQIGLDIVAPALVQQMNRISGINRLLLAFPDNIRHTNHDAMDKNVKGSFAQNKPMDMKGIRDIAQEMVNQIYP